MLKRPKNQTFEDEGQPPSEGESIENDPPQDTDHQKFYSTETIKPDLNSLHKDGAMANRTHLTCEVKTGEPLLGNFSESSSDIELTRFTLFARCIDEDGVAVESSINLNDCVAIENARLFWKRNGRAFSEMIRSRVTEGGKVLQMLVFGDRSLQMGGSLLLDGQIKNDNGRLVFLDSASKRDEAPNVNAGARMATVDLTDVERVKWAENWAITTLKMDLDAFALERIGFTFLDYAYDRDIAIEYFEKAAKEARSSHCAIGLARAFAGKAECLGATESEEQLYYYGKAIKSIQIALTIFRAEAQPEFNQETFRQDDDTWRVDGGIYDLFNLPTQAADYQKLRNGQVASIELLEEALKCRPWSANCRWQLLELLCRTDCHTRAQTVFEDWSTMPGLPKSETLSGLSREKLINEFRHTGYLRVIDLMRGTKLHIRIQDVMKKAVENEAELQSKTDQVWLRYALGLIMASAGGPENLQVAYENWVEAFNLKASREQWYIEETPVTRSSYLICMNFFDQARQELTESSTTSSQDFTARLDRLASQISRFLLPISYELLAYQRPDTYVAALGRLVGQLDYSKKILRQDITSAIDILPDDNIWNDDAGIEQLFGVLLAYGDYEGALTAWSLLDRYETRGKAYERGRNEPRTMSETETHWDPTVKSEQVQPQCDNVTSSELEDSLDQEGQDNTAQQPVKTHVNACAGNCGCDSLWSSGDKEMCGVSSRTTDAIRNTPLLLIGHFDYSVEELKGNNVRIDWELKTTEIDLEEHGVHKKIIKRERIGGRIVDLDEWLEILRKEWNIPKTDMEGVLQQ